MPQEFKDGALPDPRSTEDKLKDFKFKEVVATANPVSWQEKKPDQWRRFPIFNQNSSGSCVAQTSAKEMGILRWLKDGIYVHFSATDIYQKRINKPSAGMVAYDARSIISKSGATLELLTPSQNMSDEQMDAVAIANYKRQIGDVFKVSNYVELPAGDIETVASTIQTTSKGVMVWFWFKSSEWTDYPKATSNVNFNTALHHSVTAVDYCLINGKKHIIIEDSWGPNFGLTGQRAISEDFFKKRNYYASYLTQFKFDDPVDPITPKPSFVFKKLLKFGMENKDVAALQDALRYFGHFPTNINPSNYYGAVTAKAVLEWQKKNNVAPMAELTELAGRTFGQKSVNKMNQMLS